MGLMDFIKGQFIEVIEWTDSSTDTILYRFPVQGKEIKMGAQLIVRESQMAVFINEGQIADVFTPGRYELSTQNMPILTKLRSWKYAFNSPFKAEVYFINTKQFTNQRWGTTKPALIRDPYFGMVMIRGFGVYSFKVSDPVKLIKEAAGTSEVFNASFIGEQLKRYIVSGLNDAIAESKIPIDQLTAQYDELGKFMLEKMKDKFSQYGLTIVDMVIESLSLPDEVEQAILKRASVQAMGGTNEYTRIQAADAMRDAAQNEGNGFAGMGAGFGAGSAIGNMMGQALNQNQQYNNNPSQVNIINEEEIVCKCGTRLPKNAKFCYSCGEKLVNEIKCTSCGASLPAGAKFCFECGKSLEKKCSKCGNKLEENQKFCLECGTKVGEE